VKNFKAGNKLAAKMLEDAGYTLEGGRLHYPGDRKETLAK
jgi:peptide/nickel transport system substrate-binding protein